MADRSDSRSEPFKVTTRTIERRRKVKRFADVIERGRAKGRISVRRQQLKLLEAGNATMGVWLGKQILGQTDEIRQKSVVRLYRYVCLASLRYRPSVLKSDRVPVGRKSKPPVETVSATNERGPITFASLHPPRPRAMLSSMRAIGYIRVSTDKQADHGVSLEAQAAKIRAMAVLQGAEIIVSAR